MTPEQVRLILPGAAQAAASLFDYVLGLAKTAGLTEAQARAELAPLYERLMARADRVEAAPIFDPDALPEPKPTV